MQNEGLLHRRNGAGGLISLAREYHMEQLRRQNKPTLSFREKPVLIWKLSFVNMTNLSEPDAHVHRIIKVTFDRVG